MGGWGGGEMSLLKFFTIDLMISIIDPSMKVCSKCVLGLGTVVNLTVFFEDAFTQ